MRSSGARASRRAPLTRAVGPPADRKGVLRPGMLADARSHRTAHRPPFCQPEHDVVVLRQPVVWGVLFPRSGPRARAETRRSARSGSRRSVCARRRGAWAHDAGRAPKRVETAPGQEAQCVNTSRASRRTRPVSGHGCLVRRRNVSRRRRRFVPAPPSSPIVMQGNSDSMHGAMGL
jgi:hypothetical protein